MPDVRESSANYLFDMLDEVIKSLSVSRLQFPSVPVVVPDAQSPKSLKSRAVPVVPVLPTPKQEVVTDTAPTGEEYGPVPDERSRASSLLFTMGKTGTAGTPAETLGKTVPVAVPVAFLDGNNDSRNHCVLSLSPELLDAYEERAAIMEYDAGLTRPQAERLAWVEVFSCDP
jgi:hypothetical protein